LESFTVTNISSFFRTLRLNFSFLAFTDINSSLFSLTFVAKLFVSLAVTDGVVNSRADLIFFTNSRASSTKLSGNTFIAVLFVGLAIADWLVFFSARLRSRLNNGIYNRKNWLFYYTTVSLVQLILFNKNMNSATRTRSDIVTIISNLNPRASSASLFEFEDSSHFIASRTSNSNDIY